MRASLRARAAALLLAPPTTPAEAKPAPHFCSACGAAVRPTDAFCSQCGSKLSA
jgi:predicted amidophosphoribosyltransferase